MSKVLFSSGDLTVEGVERTGRIDARSPDFVRIRIGTDEPVDLEPPDVEALVAALDLWLEDRRE